MSKKQIVLINLGGTITSVRTESGRLQSGSMSGEELLQDIDLNLDIDLKIVETKSIPSPMMTMADMKDIEASIKEEIAQGAEGIVLTHGTDTMEETSYFIDLLVDTEVPIAFTGSQRSIADLGFDGHANIRDAILTVSSEESRNKGVLVVFNQEIYPARGVMKVNSYGLQGFGSTDSGPLGVVYNQDVHYFYDVHKKKKLDIEDGDFTNKVHLIKLSMDMDRSMVDALVAAGTEGFVFEGFGAGGVVPQVQDAIEEAIEAGVECVLVTKALTGGVHTLYDSKGAAIQLGNLGVVLDGTFATGPQARMKLIAMLNSKQKDQIKEVWNQY